MIIRYLILWIAALFAASQAHGQAFPTRPNGPVLDEAGLLTPAQAVDLDGKLRAFFDRTGRTIVVATVKSLNGQEISPYATELGRRWGIGDKDKDIGVLLLVAPSERKVWIATGYGGDDYLTDAMSGVIIRQDILPRFKAGDMGGGIVAGVDAIIRQLDLPPDQASRRAREAESANRSSTNVGGAAVIPIVIVGFVLFMMLAGLRRGGGRRYRSHRRSGGVDPWVVLWGLNEISRASRGSGGWGGWGGGGGFGGFGGGGGGGGGFGGFGGGSFGGGGAGGSW